MENHRWIKQVAKMMVPDRKKEREREGARGWSEFEPCLKDRTPRTPVVNKHQDRFRLWNKETYWDDKTEYEEDITEVVYIEEDEYKSEFEPCLKDKITRTPGVNKHQDRFRLWNKETYWEEKTECEENITEVMHIEEDEYNHEYEDISEVPCREEVKFKFKCEVKYRDDEEEDEYESDYEDVTDYEYEEDYEKDISEVMYKEEVKLKCEVKCRDDEYENDEDEYEDEDISEVAYKEEARYEVECDVECEEQVEGEEQVVSKEDMKEDYYWKRQLDDFLSQNPREKKYMEKWWRSLNPDDLNRILQKEQKLGRFKPRYLREDEKWRKKYKTKSFMDENQQPVQPVHEVSYNEEEDKYYRLRQIDDLMDQNPTWRKWEVYLLELHPDDLKFTLKEEQQRGTFKPRNWSNDEWIEFKLRGSEKIKQPVHEQPQKQLEHQKKQTFQEQVLAVQQLFIELEQQLEDQQRQQQQQHQQGQIQQLQQKQLQQQQYNHRLRQQQEQQQRWQQQQWQQRHWQPEQLQQQHRQQQYNKQPRSTIFLNTPSLVEKQQKFQMKQQEDQKQQRSGTHQYQVNRSVDNGCDKQDNLPDQIKPQEPLRHQEETKPEESIGKNPNQSLRKPEGNNITKTLSVSIIPPLSLRPQEETEPEVSLGRTSTQTEKNKENDDKKPRVKKQERVRKKRNKAYFLKTQALPKNEIKLIQTRNDFQTRQMISPIKTKVSIFQKQPRMEFMIIKQMKDKNKNDPACMMSNWESNSQKNEDPENLDQKGKILKVANIMHKKIQQEEGTKDKERMEIPSITRRKALEHGRPPEKINRKAGR